MRSVLVVDDDAQCRRLTVRLLRQLGYESTFEAASAAEAILMLPRVKPAVVLTDIVMEHQSSGLDVAEHARAEGIAIGLLSGATPYSGDPLLARLPLLLKEELRLDSLEALMATLQRVG